MTPIRRKYSKLKRKDHLCSVVVRFFATPQKMQMENYQMVRGLPFPGSRFFPKENIENTLDYVPRDGDVIIASYPKTGTTWLQYIVLQIISRGECFPTFDDVLRKIAPFMEYAGLKAVEELKEPRSYKHHCPYNMVPKNPKSKYLYTYRNPEDTLVSYFHFLNESRRDNPFDLEHYFEGFLSGNIGYGRYFEHVLSYWEHKDDENLLLVSYEKLHLNRKEEIMKIAKFLGKEYYQAILEDESILEKIVEHTSFEFMKKELFLYRTTRLEHEECSDGYRIKVNFFRKGVIGEGRQSLSEDQLKRLREVMQHVLKGTSLLEEWINE